MIYDKIHDTKKKKHLQSVLVEPGQAHKHPA